MSAIVDFADGEAHIDAAIALLRQMLPQYGLRIVLPPPLPQIVQSEAYASIWRRGEARALSWHAATPALALWRAIRNELEDQHDAQLLRGCTQCNGIGWYIAFGGSRQMCQHARGSIQPIARAQTTPLPIG